MSSLTPELSAWLATHHGVVTASDLHRMGFTRHEIQHLVAGGVFIRYVRGVYRLAAAPAGPNLNAALACAVAPDVVVGRTSAVRLWGLRRMGRDRSLHILIPWSKERTVPEAVVHRSTRIDPGDVVQRDDGIRLTSPPRTVFDAAAQLDDAAVESVIEQVLHDFCTMPTLLDTARRLAHRGRPGTERFLRVLHRRPKWLKPVDSDLELQLERAIVQAGLPRPLRGHPVTLPGGQVVHPDFLWVDQSETVEVDHITWHGGKLDLTYDKWRDRQLRRVGIHVTRVTDDDVRERLDEVLEDLIDLLGRSRAGNAA